MPSTVPELNLQNSQRLYDLIQDGKLRISLQDAIALALENNLTLASFRYNFPIAQADLQRTKAGGNANGVNTSVVSTTASGFGASGAVVAPQLSATAGNGGLVTSTLGAGAAVPPFDPFLIFSGYVQHTVTPEPNLSQVGVELYKVNNIEVQSQYQQYFPLGTYLQVNYTGFRAANNSPYFAVNPELNSNFQVLPAASRFCTDSALPATSASSTSPKETCRPPISPFSSRSSPPSPTLRSSIGIWSTLIRTCR